MRFGVPVRYVDHCVALAPDANRAKVAVSATQEGGGRPAVWRQGDMDGSGQRHLGGMEKGGGRLNR